MQVIYFGVISLDYKFQLSSSANDSDMNKSFRSNCCYQKDKNHGLNVWVNQTGGNCLRKMQKTNADLSTRVTDSCEPVEVWCRDYRGSLVSLSCGSSIKAFLFFFFYGRGVPSGIVLNTDTSLGLITSSWVAWSDVSTWNASWPCVHSWPLQRYKVLFTHETFYYVRR